MLRELLAICCARAASGHAAAPPSNDMNSRRFMGVTQGQLITNYV